MPGESRLAWLLGDAAGLRASTGKLKPGLRDLYLALPFGALGLYGFAHRRFRLCPWIEIAVHARNIVAVRRKRYVVAAAP
jgi:hypothetical protein